MFSRIVEWSLRSRGLVLALALVFLIVGARVAQQLPVDVLPDLTRPTVMVQVESPGFAPEDIEPLITYPIETALSGLPDVQRVRSVSSPDLTVVYAEFDWESDPYRDRQLVAERLEALRGQLPNGAQPLIGPITSLMGEILLLSLTSEHDSITPMALREVADWTLRPALMSIPGVAQVIPIGGDVRQFEVQPDLERLRLLNVPLGNLVQAVSGFGRNLGGGFADAGGREYAIRSIGRPFKTEDLRQVAVLDRNGNTLRMHQLADVVTGARIKRGEAGLDGHPAVILSVQKQPGADTLQLTQAIEQRLAGLDAALPEGVIRGTIFRQADFIHESIDNVRGALWGAALITALVLFVFLNSSRAIGIALAAIPLSIVAAIVALHLLGLSINTMTLGGLAIAIGELVDDAVVGIENVLRRLRMRANDTTTIAQIIARATIEVRSGILYATLIIVLVFLPLFALGGMEGHLFEPLGIAYIVAILASLLVAITLTPVLCAFAFNNATAGSHDERRWLHHLKSRYIAALQNVLDHSAFCFVAAAILVVLAIAMTAALPRSFLPPFNERTLTINLLLEPGVSLTESDRLGRIAEKVLLQVPEVEHVGRRTGRGELDEHAEGVHYSEIEVSLKSGGRARNAVIADIRARLSPLPGMLSIGAPISHRLDHLLSGVRAPLVFKIIGDDLPTLRHLASRVREQLLSIPGLADVQLEKQVDVPQVQAHVDSRAAAQYGVEPAAVQDVLSQLTIGRTLSQIVEGERRLDLVVRLPEAQRSPAALANLLIDTPGGAVPLSWIARFDEAGGPNQILREDLRRRLVVAAYPDQTHGAANFDVASAQARSAVDSLALPPGYEIHAEGEQSAQQQAFVRIGGLALLSLLLIAVVLQGRYRSWCLSLMILGNVPFALIGGVAALWLTTTPLSAASLIGFITLTGITSRNGILKISHFIHLARDEGESFGRELVLRGSRERLTPVLMTALIAALALMPLLWQGAEPGKEILHPVALVIFGGLISSTILDSFITPALFIRFGRKPLQHHLARNGVQELF
jgi:HME family heavy-metal exporter